MTIKLTVADILNYLKYLDKEPKKHFRVFKLTKFETNEVHLPVFNIRKFLNEHTNS